MTPVPAGSLLVRHPWLLDASTWRHDWPGNTIAPHQSGAWPIGNGRVFAHAGLALPFNRLQGITGPTYQTEGDRRVEGARMRGLKPRLGHLPLEAAREGERVRRALERTFWLDDPGHYAPALYGSSTALPPILRTAQPLPCPRQPLSLLDGLPPSR